MDKLKKILIASGFTLYAIAIIAFGLTATQKDTAQYGANTVLPAGLVTYNLSGSGVSSSATSVGLTSLTIPQNGYVLQDADFSSTFYITIEPGSRTRQEFASCTTVTQNAGGTATLSGCTRGLSPISPYTASSTLQFSHSGGSNVIFSNPPQLYEQYAAKGNDESISGTWTFADSPLLTTDCTVASADTEICAKAYIDGVAVAGASDANLTTKGIVEISTQTQAASSTTLGETGAYLALPANMATDTPNTATRASRLLMSDLTGYLKQGWLNLTEAFTWTGAHIFGSTIAVTGTATFNGETTNNATSTFNSGVIGLNKYEVFTATGTWTKPAWVNASSTVEVECWGGGGGGGRSAATEGAGGGGGGAYGDRKLLASALGATVTVTIGDGGAAGSEDSAGGTGGTSSFGTFLYAYGGGGGINASAGNQGAGGGGGGTMGAGGAATANSGGVGGVLLGGAGVAAGGDSTFGGGGGTNASATGGESYYGGGGGAGSTNASGSSVYGGGGGAGEDNSGGNGTAGTSIYGGNGGAVASAGAIPAGGGGAGYNTAPGAGARGECRVTTYK